MSIERAAQQFARTAWGRTEVADHPGTYGYRVDETSHGGRPLPGEPSGLRETPDPRWEQAVDALRAELLASVSVRPVHYALDFTAEGTWSLLVGTDKHLRLIAGWERALGRAPKTALAPPSAAVPASVGGWTRERLERQVTEAKARGLEVAPSVSSEEFAATERTLGFALPDALRYLYSLGNGGQLFTDGILPWLSLAGIRKSWSMWLSVAADWTDPIGMVTPKGTVAEVVFHRHWVPLLGDGEEFVALDLAPGPKGVAGQVVAGGGDDDLTPALLATGLDAWLDGVAPSTARSVPASFRPPIPRAEWGRDLTPADRDAVPPRVKELDLFPWGDVSVTQLCGIQMEALVVGGELNDLDRLRTMGVARIRASNTFVDATDLAGDPALVEVHFARADTIAHPEALLSLPNLRSMTLPSAAWLAMPEVARALGSRLTEARGGSDVPLAEQVRAMELVDRPKNRIRDRSRWFEGRCWP